MKVICISHENFAKIPYHKEWDIQIGEEKTVIDTDKFRGVPVYRFKGHPGWMYDQRNFAVVSDIDETELIAEREAVGV